MASEPKSDGEVIAKSKLVAPVGVHIGCWQLSTMETVMASVAGMVAGALLLTLAAPVVSANPPPWNYISAFIGWLYFLAWGVSFLPQLYINYVRQSVVGQSFDFVAYNCLGFFCYAVYNICFYASTPIQEAYSERNHDEKNTVALNDVVFAVYALGCSLLNGFQILIFFRGDQTVSRISVVVICGAIAVLLLWLVIVVLGPGTPTMLSPLGYLYGLSTVKLGVSIIKYLPQLYLNYIRKMTHGWSIWNVLLDFSGGLLSVGQQIMDSVTTGNESGITGNPVKVALGSLSMVYDVIFIVQHFVLYRENNRSAYDDPVANAETPCIEEDCRLAEEHEQSEALDLPPDEGGKGGRGSGTGSPGRARGRPGPDDAERPIRSYNTISSVAAQP